MLEEPKIGFRIRMSIERPDPEFVRGFEGWPTGNVCDANGRGGAMNYHIKPLKPSWQFVGPAITVRARPVDNLIVYKALDIALPGDVLVITNDAYHSSSVFGDIVASIAKAKGVVALVTDGVARDAAGLREVDLPVFVAGINPNSPFKDGPGEINLPITCGGVVVRPGDIVVGDEDGVVVVACEDAPYVLKTLAKIGIKETQMKADVSAGKLIPNWLDTVMKEKGIQIIK